MGETSLSPQESSRWLKTQQWLGRSNRLEEICAYISSGNSLIDLADAGGFEYAVLMRWINGSPERRAAYDLAVADRKEWMVQTLLRELHGISTMDVRKAFDIAGNLLAINEMPAEISRAIAGFDTDEDGNVKIRFADRLRAMELLGKNLEMFVEKVKHSGTVTLEQMVAGSMEAAPAPAAIINGKSDAAAATE